jgi:hypothetical protein
MAAEVGEARCKPALELHPVLPALEERRLEVLRVDPVVLLAEGGVEDFSAGQIVIHPAPVSRSTSA